MMMYHREESEYYHAKMKAARRVVKGWVKPADLPSNSEIRDQIQALARTLEGADRDKNLQDMRVAALRMMMLCESFFPRLIGSVLTGHVRHGSDIDIHLFANNVDAVTGLLEYHRLRHDIEIKVVLKNDVATTYRHVKDNFEFELTVYPLADRLIAPKSSITGKAIERLTLPELKQFLAATYPQLDLDEAVLTSSEAVNRFEEYRGLLLPLESVKQNLHYHPEGDALYHSLQVFDLACNQAPYDEEYLLAALLHDVGKAIDVENHVAAGLEALEGLISERTYWLIEHHMLAHRLHDRSIGARARKRLESSEYFEDLLKLNECDRLGRKCGIETTDLDDALDYVRELDQW